MSEGKLAVAWDHTSRLLAMLYSTHRGKKDQKLQPYHFLPKRFRRRLPPEQPRKRVMVPITALKDVFVNVPASKGIEP